jgi:serine/threonine protein kinase
MTLDRDTQFGKILLRFPTPVPIQTTTFLKMMEFAGIQEGIEWDLQHPKPWFFVISPNEIMLNLQAYLDCYPVFKEQIPIIPSSSPHLGGMNNDFPLSNNFLKERTTRDKSKQKELQMDTRLDQDIIFSPKDHHGFQIQDMFDLYGQKYEIVAEIARGGMGVVYKADAIDKEASPASVIIKFFQYAQYYNTTTNNNNCEQYWLNEAEVTQIQTLSPQRSMGFFGKFSDPTQTPTDYYLFLEFLQGRSLADWYHEVWLQSDRRSIQQIGSEGWIFLIEHLLLPVVDHLAFIHSKGIVHRDITPKNIMIMESGVQTYPVLIDWGVAKKISNEKIYYPSKPYFNHATATGTAIFNSGSAPEIIGGHEPIATTDIYMVGALIYYLASGGKFPGMAATREHYVLHPFQMNPMVPKSISLLVEKMTQYEPADRIRSMEEVDQLFREILVELNQDRYKFRLKSEDYQLLENILQNPYYILNWKAVKELYLDLVKTKQGLFEKQPPTSQFYVLLGYFACFKQELEIAWDYMSRSLELDGKNVHGIALKAYLLYEKGDKELSESLLRQLNVESPKNPFILYSLAKILSEKGQIKEADQYLDMILSQNALELNALNAKGILMKMQGKYSEAEDFFQQCVRISPNFIVSWSNLGNLYKTQKKFAEAELYYKKALELNPNYISALQNLVAVETQLGKSNDAQIYIDHISKIEPQIKK